MTSILHLSDLHLNEASLSRNGGGNDERLAMVLGEIVERRLHVDACVITGDLTHNGETTGYERLAKLLNSCPWPTKVVPGNHDNRETGRAILGDLYWPGSDPWIWDINGKTLMVGLSTLVPGFNHGEIAAHMIVVLENLFSSIGDAESVIVACHHPPVDIGHWWMDGQRLLAGSEKFLSILLKNGVLAVFCGHTHICSFSTFQGIQVITAPSIAHEVVYDDSLERPLLFRPQTPRALLHRVEGKSLTSIELTMGGASWLVNGLPWKEEVLRTNQRRPAPRLD